MLLGWYNKVKLSIFKNGRLNIMFKDIIYNSIIQSIDVKKNILNDPKLIKGILGELERKYPDVIKLNRESLVSIDYKGIKQSCVIDLQWLEIINNKLKLILWYDNEWGYSNRVIDLVKLISNK